MAENSELVSMAQAFTGLPIQDLIGGPLMAACDANNMMAMTQANYILQTGFTKVSVAGQPDVYKVVEVEVELTRPVIIPGTATDADPDPEPTIREVVSKVRMPLLSMLPIPSLGIDRVAITFDMEVKSSYGKEVSASTTKEIGAQASFEAKFERGPFSVGIKGSASYSQKDASSSSENIQRSNSANYHIEVSASQQPQPQGLALILDAFAKNIGPYTMPTEPPPPLGSASPVTGALGGPGSIPPDSARMLSGSASL